MSVTPPPSLSPLLTNERAHREWAWLLSRFSEKQLSLAISSLGSQRPYPLNIARKLKVSLPGETELPLTSTQKESSRVAMRKSIDEARALLRKRS